MTTPAPEPCHCPLLPSPGLPRTLRRPPAPAATSPAPELFPWRRPPPSRAANRRRPSLSRAARDTWPIPKPPARSPINSGRHRPRRPQPPAYPTPLTTAAARVCHQWPPPQSAVDGAARDTWSPSEPTSMPQHYSGRHRPLPTPTDHASYPKRHQWRGPPWPFSGHRGTDLLTL